MKVTLKKVRLCFAKNVFVASKPSIADASAKDKYQGEFIVERGSENHKIMSAAINAEALREWGEKSADNLKAVAATGKVWCLRDGDLKDRPEYKGHLVVSAKNEMRPLVIDGNRSPLQFSDGTLYSGCYVNAIIDVKAGSKPSKQLYAYLLGVQYDSEGDRLSGAVAAADDFEAIPGTEAAAVSGANGGLPASGAAALFG